MRITMSKERIPKFKIGDKVKLNVGGPDMAVESIVEERIGNRGFTGNYRCQWFAGKKLDKGTFPEESLIEVIDREEKTPRHDNGA